MSEVWAPVLDWPDYMISNQGRVKNCRKDQIRKPYVNPKGYTAVTFCKNGK